MRCFSQQTIPLVEQSVLRCVQALLFVVRGCPSGGIFEQHLIGAEGVVGQRPDGLSPGLGLHASPRQIAIYLLPGVGCRISGQGVRSASSHIQITIPHLVEGLGIVRADGLT